MNPPKVFEGAEALEFINHNNLEKISINKETWEILYKSAKDHSMWKLFCKYPEMHGGGIPVLLEVSENNAKESFLI